MKRGLIIIVLVFMVSILMALFLSSSSQTQVSAEGKLALSEVNDWYNVVDILKEGSGYNYGIDMWGNIFKTSPEQSGSTGSGSGSVQPSSPLGSDPNLPSTTGEGGSSGSALGSDPNLPSTTGEGGPTGAIGNPGSSSSDSGSLSLSEAKAQLTEKIAKILNLVFALAGAIFVIMFIIGGIQYLTSAGNEESNQKAKKLLVNAVIGIILVVISFALSVWILNSLGVKLPDIMPQN